MLDMGVVRLSPGSHEQGLHLASHQLAVMLIGDVVQQRHKLCPRDG